MIATRGLGRNGVGRVGLASAGMGIYSAAALFVLEVLRLSSYITRSIFKKSEI